MIFVALYRVSRVKVFAESFKIHGQLAGQILYDLVKLAHIDRIYLLGKGPGSISSRCIIFVIVLLLQALILHNAESLFKNAPLLLKRGQHMVELSVIGLDQLSQLW